MPTSLRRLRHVARLGVALVAVGACSAERRAPTQEGFIPVTRGARLYYRAVGAGRDTVVVLHGGPGLHSRYLYSALDGLAQDRVLIYYDQRGRGRSEPSTDAAALTAAQDVADLDSLRRFFRLSQMKLAAHHWGAALAVLYAKRYPDRVSRVLIVSPSFPSADLLFVAATEPNDPAATAAFLAATAAGRDTTDPRDFCARFWGFMFVPIEVTEASLVRRLGGAMCDAPSAALRAGPSINRIILGSLHGLTLRDTIAGVAVPTLVMQGAGDTASAESGRTWARWLPNARFLMLPPPDLFPWLGDAARFGDAARTFLGGGWPATAERLGPVGPPLHAARARGESKRR